MFTVRSSDPVLIAPVKWGVDVLRVSCFKSGVMYPVHHITMESMMHCLGGVLQWLGCYEPRIHRAKHDCLCERSGWQEFNKMCFVNIAQPRFTQCLYRCFLLML